MDRTIELPAPQIDLEFPLMQALQQRRTRRKWNHLEISLQHISNLLWAACGQTVAATPRSKSKRTVPSARNSQAIKVYVVMPNGCYLYNEVQHRLEHSLSDDLRSHLSNQKMMKSAPLGLVYVADYARLKGYVGVDEHRKWFVAGTETGFISQNVYLYCASAGFSTAIIGLVNRDQLHQAMHLPPSERVVYTQVVG